MGYDGCNSFGKGSDYQVNNFGAKICCHPKKHVPRNQYRDKWRLWKYHGLQKKSQLYFQKAPTVFFKQKHQL